MRFACLLAAGAVASSAASAGEGRAEICRKGADERVIEIIAPGDVGAACDVRYTREAGADVRVPYHANVDGDFCLARAAELAATLTAEGFLCERRTDESVEAALAGGPSPVAEADLSEPLDVQLARLTGDSADPPPHAPLLEQPAPEPAPQGIALAGDEATAPTPAAAAPADAGPIQLAGDARTSEFRAPKPPKSTGAGRLVGAAPAIDDIVDIAPEPARADPATTAAASAAGIPPRQADDIIRGVIAANAAAWNEGNLKAYMNGYAPSADVLLIKNAVVTSGRRQVEELFARESAAAGEMGRLSFAALDVKMTAEDVASVVGRYRLSRAAGEEAGVVTLVMKRIDGRWRILQDARIEDAQSTE